MEKEWHISITFGVKNDMSDLYNEQEQDSWINRGKNFKNVSKISMHYNWGFWKHHEDGANEQQNYNVRAMSEMKHSHKIALFFTSYSFNLLILSSSHLSPSNM